MNTLWTLILITNGFAFPYAHYPSKEACYGDGMIFYAEMMGKNQGEVICQEATTKKIVYVTREMDQMNRKGRELKKNPPPPRPWAEVEQEIDDRIERCTQGDSFGRPRSPCYEKLHAEKRSIYRRYKDKGLIK